MAQEGNTNSRKWTVEAAQQFFYDLLEYCKANKDGVTMAKACNEVGGYSTLPNYLMTDFPDSNLLDLEPYKKAKSICEACLAHNGLTGKYQVAMAIFLLKKNHDMDDTLDVQSGGKPVSISPIKWTDGSGQD